MSATIQHARNGDVRIAYEVRGDGDPVLFIHGLAYNRLGWGPGLDELASSFTVVTFDNRGVGESDAPPPPFTVLDMARDALAVLDAAGFERAHVVGTSLGGMIAQQFALAFPERVDRLVLACTHPGGTAHVPMPQRSVDAFTRYQGLPREERLRVLVRNSLSDATVESRPELVGEIYRYRLAHAPPLEAWQAQAAASLTHDTYDRLGELTMPTLVLHGTADNVVDPRNAELLASRIPDARVELVEGAGHLFFWEEPARFAAVVREFLC